MTRIAVVNRDVPFLVDSISRAIAAQGLTVDMLVHPILPVRRDSNWDLAELPVGEGSGEKRESFIYIETDRIDAKQRRLLEAELKRAIGDVRAAVADWPRMRELISADPDRLSDAEGAALLRWLGGGKMTQLGHVTRHRDGKQADVLGICRKSAGEVLADTTWDRAFAWFDGKNGTPGRAPLVIKANRLSLLHRRVPLDMFRRSGECGAGPDADMGRQGSHSAIACATRLSAPWWPTAWSTAWALFTPSSWQRKRASGWTVWAAPSCLPAT